MSLTQSLSLSFSVFYISNSISTSAHTLLITHPLALHSCYCSSVSPLFLLPLSLSLSLTLTLVTLSQPSLLTFYSLLSLSHTFLLILVFLTQNKPYNHLSWSQLLLVIQCILQCFFHSLPHTHSVTSSLFYITSVCLSLSLIHTLLITFFFALCSCYSHSVSCNLTGIFSHTLSLSHPLNLTHSSSNRHHSLFSFTSVSLAHISLYLYFFLNHTHFLTPSFLLSTSVIDFVSLQSYSPYLYHTVTLIHLIFYIHSTSNPLSLKALSISLFSLTSITLTCFLVYLFLSHSHTHSLTPSILVSTTSDSMSHAMLCSVSLSCSLSHPLLSHFTHFCLSHTLLSISLYFSFSNTHTPFNLHSWFQFLLLNH